MKLIDSSINISIPRVDKLKKQYIINEELLQDAYNEATILPIPDDAPEDIPRILIQTKGEHSQLSITPNAFSFQTHYSDDFVYDWSKCKEYLSERINDVFKLVNTISDNSINYVGVVVNYILDNDEYEGGKYLYKKYSGKDAPNNLDDFSMKYVFIENDKYYINIFLQSIKNFNPVAAGINYPLNRNSIYVTLDINDKYNLIKNGASSNLECFDQELKMISHWIENNPLDLLDNGD